MPQQQTQTSEKPDLGKSSSGSSSRYITRGKLLLLCTVLVPILAFLAKDIAAFSKYQWLPSSLPAAFDIVGKQKHRAYGFVGEHVSELGYEGVVYRDADVESPFYDVGVKLDWVDLRRRRRIYDGIVSHIGERYEEGEALVDVEEQSLLEQWDGPDPKLRRLSRCKLLVSSMYRQDMNWNNSAILSGVGNENEKTDKDAQLRNSTLVVERLRIYNYCFLDGILGEGLNTEEVFSAKFFQFRQLDEWDFQCRMFPFLKCNTDIDNEMLWPEVYNLTFQGNISEEQKFQFKSDPKPSLPSGTTLRSFNVNFMRNWARYSKGKGIVTTMSLLQISLFKRHLRVLDKLGNTLPIQVVTTDVEYNDVFLTVLLGAIGQSQQQQQQQVSLVNLRGITNDDFLKQQNDPFLFKWFAALFNTFEEELLIDADTVLFEPATSYFDISEYKRTGIYMYRDRSLPVNHTAKCKNYMFRLEPSLEEARLTDIKLAYNRNELSEYIPGIISTEELVYYRFFEDNEHNHVDSGVVVLNKRRKFNGLLLGITLNLTPLLHPCSHGDKEFFWLGQLYAGESYAINPYAGGAAGELHDDYNVHLHIHRYTICSTHIAHLNEQGKLSWVNGGLNRCKRSACAQLDFEWMGEYFASFATDVADVERYYNEPAKMDGVLIPFSGSWKLGFECCGTENCAILFEKDSREGFPGEGVLRNFSSSDIEYYNEIARIWSE